MRSYSLFNPCDPARYMFFSKLFLSSLRRPSTRVGTVEPKKYAHGLLVHSFHYRFTFLSHRVIRDCFSCTDPEGIGETDL